MSKITGFVCMHVFPSIQNIVSDGKFYIEKRAISGQPHEGWVVDPPSVFPHERWVALSDGNSGLAVLSEGLPEHNIVPDGDEMYIALTLLRCIGWLSVQDNPSRPGHAGPPAQTPDAQCQGSYTFRYALLPFSGDFQEDLVLNASRQFDAKPQVKQLHQTPLSHPASLSLLQLSPSTLVMSTIKKSEDGKYMCLRFYNSKETAVDARIEGDLAVKEVWRARADETAIEQIGYQELKLDIDFTVDGYEIVTLLLDVDWPASVE
ncbi:MAG: glycosyl hydrolase-related protein [Spirochaetia bacterium]|nr:glycosyl hydrolase-related protein [Spirochaetia bacterium]